MAYPIYHGIRLAQNATIENFVVEGLATDPVVTTSGRAWFNTTDKVWKFSALDAGGAVITRTVISAEDVAELNTARDALLSSTDAGKGSALVGFSGKTGANNKFSVVAGNVESTLVSVITEIDSVKKSVEDSSTSITDTLASQVSGSDGASLVGFEGKTGTNGELDVAAGTVTATLSTVVEAIDTDRKNLKDNYLDKTSTSAQVVNASETEFKGTVRFTGDIIQEGATKIAVGEEVIFEDNIITLNSNVLPDATPTETCGWAVNRGVEGTTEIVLWQESTKKLTAIKDASDKANLVYDNIAFQGDLDALSTAVDGRLDSLESKVGDSIGDPATLKTEDKTTLVGAINEIHDQEDLRASDLLSTDSGKGNALVGYFGKTGANSKFSVAAGTSKDSLDLIVVAVDTDRQATADREVELASTDAGKGSKNIGFSGQAGVNSKFSLAAGTVEDSLKAIAVEADAVRKSLEDDVNAGLNSLVDSLNASKYKTTSATAETLHTIAHNLNSVEISIKVWVDNGGVWQNDIVAESIVDSNTIQIDLTVAKKVKVMVEKFDSISIA